METHATYLLLGSNQGSSETMIATAIQKLEKSCGTILKKSQLYLTEPWGFDSENHFVNQVILLETSKSARELLQIIHNIEGRLGRVRNGIGYTSRSIDIDILLFGMEIIDEKDLTIPHPRLHERRFTLVPLAEIAADRIHPLLLKPVAVLLRECTDDKTVRRLI